MYNTQAQLVRSRIYNLLDEDPKLVGSLIRLAFHDATTWENGSGGGANGSIQCELEWSENRALSKPLSLVKDIQESLSLADTIALAGAASIEHAGGPPIPIRLGRIDAPQADPYRLKRPLQKSTERSKVTSTMPYAGSDSDGLRLYFGTRLGLREDEWVASSGIHGLGRHATLPGMPKPCRKNLTRACLEEAPVSLPFVTSSVDRFSNDYFKFLLKWNVRDIELGQVAFLPTDVALVVDLALKKHVERFAKDEQHFAKVFASAYQKLVEKTAVTTERY